MYYGGNITVTIVTTVRVVTIDSSILLVHLTKILIVILGYESNLVIHNTDLGSNNSNIHVH